jgi:hypothetical protein
MVFHIEREIRASPEEAFVAMADVRNEVHWNSRVSRAELVTSEPIGVGSRFRTVNRGATYDSHISVYERPRRLEFVVTGKPMDITVRFDFDPVAQTRARLRGEFDMRPKGWMKPLAPVLKLMIGRELPKQAASFAAWLSSR